MRSDEQRNYQEMKMPEKAIVFPESERERERGPRGYQAAKESDL